jgi:GT2 family glycosyltransferase
MNGIIVLNWNGYKDTIECLESVLKLKEVMVKIVVVDNGSSDDSVDCIRQYLDAQGRMVRQLSPIQTCHEMKCGKEILFIRNPTNDGYAGGNNIGIRYLLSLSEIEYVWVLNNDTVVDPHALSYLVKKIASDPNIGAVGSCLLYLENREKIWAACGGHYSKLTCGSKNIDLNLDLVNQKRSETEIEESIDYIAGASILFTRKSLQDVGLFCEDYFLYFEEPDWCNRAKRLGYRLGYASRSLVYHGVGKSTDKYSKTTGNFYAFRWLQIKNRIKFSRKFHPLSLPLVFGYILVIEMLAASKFIYKKLSKLTHNS